jgi:DNA-directed RNA polymerase specialized sigma24 family protein
VFLLRELEGFSHKEIAAVIEISENNSRVRLFRARQALRELLTA